MIEVHNPQTFFAIVGMPSSGTTIIANLFNSSSNTTCAMEPLLNEELNGTGFKEKSSENMVERIAYDGECKHLQAFGIKETWSRMRRMYAETVITCDYLDVSIFVFRDPQCLYNSWIKHAGKQSPHNFCGEYQAYFEMYQQHKKKHNTIALVYEKACLGGLDYLNKQCMEWFRFDTLDVKRQPQFGMGNTEANNSDRLGLPNDSVELVNEEEGKIITEKCMEIYNGL